MQAENADLRRIEDRRAHQRAEDAAVGDRERAALEILERQRAVLRALREIANRQLDVGEAHAIGIANHRHDEAALGADGHADVVVVLVDDLVALDLGVDRRERLERADRRLDEERGDADADAELLGERFLAALAQLPSRAVMSTSLKVVSIAAVCCASTSRRAIVARRLRHALARLAAVAGRGGLGRRCLGCLRARRLRCRRRCRGAGAAAFSTSCLVTRPPCPSLRRLPSFTS